MDEIIESGYYLNFEEAVLAETLMICIVKGTLAPTKYTRPRIRKLPLSIHE
ncbi:MAG: hypothetical protein IPO63_11950 [Bacteroidetes bacterium]|nr:hypothetical protein [Bacteroidota bacterium]